MSEKESAKADLQLREIVTFNSLLIETFCERQVTKSPKVPIKMTILSILF